MSASPVGDFTLHEGDVRDAYGSWPTPATIISDGAYGIGGFPGDPRTAAELPDWYRDHVAAWSQHAHPSSTVWFWNTEIGWATVHPLLVEHGWQYEQCHTWNKGKGQIAGNVNGNSIRRFPTVTEVCVMYSRRPVVTPHHGEPAPEGDAPSASDKVHMQQWLRSEWKRTGLPFRMANEACGVKDAATRKYFDQGHLWYFPPPSIMEQLVEFANRHGDPAGRPYYSLDGRAPVTSEEWSKLRYKWNYQHGIVNVWELPSLRGAERYRGSGERAAPRVHKPSKLSTTHLNQKPLEMMRWIVGACTDAGDVVWEPFGGLASASVAAVELRRQAFVAEQVPQFASLARERLTEATLLRQMPGDAQGLTPTGDTTRSKPQAHQLSWQKTLTPAT